MKSDKILILGSCGQIGVELTLALRTQYGNGAVIATDIKEEHSLLKGTGPFYQVDVMDINAVLALVKKEQITQIYLLAALLSATGEKMPLKAWDINMTSLLQVLEMSVQEKITKVYWPSSIAVFGSTTPKQATPQKTIVLPNTQILGTD
jgi:nucleoside-diphosphate-sugar epimerase